jgi:hypothetical protein
VESTEPLASWLPTRRHFLGFGDVRVGFLEVERLDGNDGVIGECRQEDAAVPRLAQLRRD